MRLQLPRSRCLLAGMQLLARFRSALPTGRVPAETPAAGRAAAAPTQREHQRILAAYNGAYEDPKLEGLLNHTVAKLVAASERPDVQYRVTILNSPRSTPSRCRPASST